MKQAIITIGIFIFVWGGILVFRHVHPHASDVAIIEMKNIPLNTKISVDGN